VQAEFANLKAQVEEPAGEDGAKGDPAATPAKAAQPKRK
jgi:hypothetical protein